MALTREELLALGGHDPGALLPHEVEAREADTRRLGDAVREAREARATGSDARGDLTRFPEYTAEGRLPGFAGLPEHLQPSNLPVGRVVPITAPLTHAERLQHATDRLAAAPAPADLQRNAAGQVIAGHPSNPRPPIEQRLRDLEGQLGAVQQQLDGIAVAVEQAQTRMAEGIASVVTALEELERLLEVRVRRDAPIFDAKSGSDR